MIPLRTTVVLIALLVASQAGAQIYTCTAADGSKVFSDEKCGPDAKKVTLSPPQIASSRPSKAEAPSARPQSAEQKAGLKPPTRTPAPTKKPVATPKLPPKQPWELESLLASCNTGNMQACTDWTHGGGPKLLREKEEQAQAQCTSGSLAGCEARYCVDGATEECRLNVLQAAKLAGNAWYVRDGDVKQPDGSTTYNVRCIKEGVREMRDVAITCNAVAGPKRCYVATPENGLSRLSLAAQRVCDPQKE
jgi:hypothetical protein